MSNSIERVASAWLDQQRKVADEAETDWAAMFRAKRRLEEESERLRNLQEMEDAKAVQSTRILQILRHLVPGDTVTITYNDPRRGGETKSIRTVSQSWADLKEKFPGRFQAPFVMLEAKVRGSNKQGMISDYGKGDVYWQPTLLTQVAKVLDLKIVSGVRVANMGVQAAGGLWVEQIGQRKYLRGDTYPHREAIRRLGFKWGADTKSWWMFASDFTRTVEEAIRQLDRKPASVVNDPPRPGQPTAKQVAYAKSLLSKLSRRDWFDIGDGSPMPSDADLAKMTSRELSALIDELKFASPY